VRNFFIAILFYPFVSIGQVKVANVFSSNMVLQRDQPVTIWGIAAPGCRVEVKLGKFTGVITAAKDSVWKVVMPKQEANAKPQSLIISCGDTAVKFENILFGDIWICSGQSNMEWETQKEMHWKEEKSFSTQPLIRCTNPPPVGRYVYGVAYNDSLNRRLTKDCFYLWNGWKTCDSSSIKTMSAVAYYFAKSIVNKTGIPIGLINLSIGGAPIETFISRDAMQKNKQFAAKVKGNWLTNESLPVWVRERGKQNVGNNPNVFKDDLGLNHAYKPGFAYESGIEPMLQLAVKGMIWYQGESNAQELDRVNEYAALLALMVNDYRKKWKQPDLPFYFVQLSSIDTVKYKGQLWPQFRDEQRKILQLVSYSGMAVCSDIGAKDDVHPTNKKDVGERLARWALNKTYKQSITPSGPLPLRATYSNGKVIISFDYMAKGLKTSDEKAVRGFSIDGRNEIAATFGDSGIIIPVNTKPEYVYYGWKPFNDANLVNSENLPASTFKIKIK
jgi:sialate O-acetylesterase